MARGWKVVEDSEGWFNVVNQYGPVALSRGYQDREKAEESMAALKSRPGFRKPWEFGAKAYEEADTFEDLVQGLKRTRTTKMVHMPNGGPAGKEKCAACGVPLKDAYASNKGGPVDSKDTFSTWTYSNKTKKGYGQHYYCSWGTLMTAVQNLRSFV